MYLSGQKFPRKENTMKRDGYKLSVIVHGKKVDEYGHGEDVYVKGRKGSEFTLRLENKNGHRILAVITVDGKSVINGEEGDLESGGYVLSPHETLDIPGWRLDNDSVARFFFTSPEESYAAKTGSPENIGVIGCAIFKEKPKPKRFRIKLENMDFPSSPRTLGPHRRELIGPNPGDFPIFGPDPILYGGGLDMGASPKEICSGLGTGFGKKSSHRVKTVEFDRREEPETYLVIRYGDHAKLTEIGVNMKKTPEVCVTPPVANPETAKPFPAAIGCPPPSGWRG